MDNKWDAVQISNNEMYNNVTIEQNFYFKTFNTEMTKTMILFGHYLWKEHSLDEYTFQFVNFLFYKTSEF